jgi:hypothetical protein
MAGIAANGKFFENTKVAFIFDIADSHEVCADRENKGWPPEILEPVSTAAQPLEEKHQRQFKHYQYGIKEDLNNKRDQKETVQSFGKVRSNLDEAGIGVQDIIHVPCTPLTQHGSDE